MHRVLLWAIIIRVEQNKGVLCYVGASKLLDHRCCGTWLTVTTTKPRVDVCTVKPRPQPYFNWPLSSLPVVCRNARSWQKNHSPSYFSLYWYHLFSTITHWLWKRHAFIELIIRIRMIIIIIIINHHHHHHNNNNDNYLFNVWCQIFLVYKMCKIVVM